MLAQDYNITLEEALEKTKHRPDFQKKIKHSVDLLRKAESLALKYDAEDGFYLAFSCGKDSQAMYHVAQMAGVKFKAHMNFTSVDPPQVIMFKRRQYPAVVEHPPRASIFDLAVEKGILPSKRIRWCCAELKESAGAGKVTLIGIRRDESSRRAKRHEVEVSNKKFSGNLDQFAKWQEEEIAKKEEKLLRKMKREGKKVNEDHFSLEKDNEVRCINGKDSILVSPIFDWSESDVWYFLNKVLGVPHCELYDQGYTRIGCIMCPMSQYKHKLRELRDFPHVKRGWIRAIKEIRKNGGVQQREYTQTSSGGISPQSDCQGKSAGCSEIGSAATPRQLSETQGVTEVGTPRANGTKCFSDWQWKFDDGRKTCIRERIGQNGLSNTQSSGCQSSVSRTCSTTSKSSVSSTHTHTHTRRATWANKQLPDHPKIYGAWIHGGANHWPMEQASQHGNLGGFSADPSAGGTVEGVHEPTEDEIAEKIFDWWISGKSYTEWYAEKYLQLKIDWGEELDQNDETEDTL